MMAVEILTAVLLARYGGELTGRDYESATRLAGWFFLGLGVSSAVLAGTHL